MLRLGYALIASLSLLALAAACGPTPPPESAVTVSYEGPVQSDDAASGERVFNQLCLTCHDDEGATPKLPGLGATPGQVRMQVREGGGRMPAFPKNKLTDAELENLLAYLQTIDAVTAAGAGPKTGGGMEPAGATEGEAGAEPKTGGGMEPAGATEGEAGAEPKTGGGMAPAGATQGEGADEGMAPAGP